MDILVETTMHVVLQSHFLALHYPSYDHCGDALDSRKDDESTAEHDRMDAKIIGQVDPCLPGHPFSTGLYRYRIGDILQVVGFHNRAPQFHFICRKNVVLSIDTDKTNEEDLHKSITAAKRLLKAHDYLLVEYTSYADASTIPGHYVLFWEIACISEDEVGRVAPLEGWLLQECCHVVEDSLDYMYRRCRSHDKSIGPLEIRLVEGGAFDALMDLCIGHGGSINQYKTPRCVESSAALELLNSKIVACFFSHREPAWSL